MLLLLLATAIAAEPDDAEVLVTRAKAALAAGDTAEAEQLLIELFQFFPDSAAAQRVARAALSSTAAASPDDEAAASALAREMTEAMAKGDTDLARQKVDDLLRRFPDSRSARSANKLKTELNLIGTTAPPLAVERWFQGEAAFPSHGATLVVFWESWCPHCNREAEHVQSIATTWAGRLDVVGLTKVTKSATDEKVAAFITEHGWTFPVGKEDDGRMSTAFAVTGIPAAVIVVDGRVAWRGHPARLTDELIDRLID